jgi:coxsackievirus/adenovirus receptor
VSPPGHDPGLPFPCDSNGRCACLPNVVGDKCDSCIPDYWNVGSGRGCEQCNCDVIGSWNNTCDVKTGQCQCKPGITGRRCEMCKVDHYAFSKLGCLGLYYIRGIILEVLHLI